MNHIRNFILDMDGVLWRGNTAVPGLAPFFDTLQAQARRFVLATNNASKTPAQYVQKLAQMGVRVTEKQVMTSALATAAYLADEYKPADTAVYVIGAEGIRTALEERGFRLLGRNDDQTPAALVVVGFTEDAVYADFATAAIHIRRGARFVGCNPDPTYPSERGELPGNGSLLALLQTATGQAPAVIGKPQPTIFHECLRRLGEAADGANTAMVGDRLTTDIQGAHRAGLHTILVLTGVTARADLADSDVQPDYVFESIAEIAAALQT